MLDQLEEINKKIDLMAKTMREIKIYAKRRLFVDILVKAIALLVFLVFFIFNSSDHTVLMHQVGLIMDSLNISYSSDDEA